MPQQVGQGRVDGRQPGRREPDQHTSPVVGVGPPLDQAVGGQPVDPVGHRPGGHQRAGEQLAGGELVRGAGPAQRGQHVEGPPLQVVRLEGGPAGAVEVAGQPGHPGEHLKRADVQVGALASPGLDQAVDLVGLRLGVRSRGMGLASLRHIVSIVS